MARKRTRYTDKFRASAVLMLEAAGYPDRKGALTSVAKNLGVPHQTLSGWARATNNPPPPEVRQEKKIDLVQAIRDELAAIFKELPLARPDAGYKDLMTGAGILIDKLRILKGEPTQYVEQRTVVYATGGRLADSAPWTNRTAEEQETVHGSGVWAQVGQDDSRADSVH